MIVCFSGTGNTFYVSSRVAEKTGLGIFMLEGDSLINPGAVKLDTDSADEAVIWAFPTYSWGIPPVVVDFIRRFNVGENMKTGRHYMLTTCGDDMGLTDQQWRKLMIRRGLNAVSAFSVIMPNTYVCMKGFDVDSEDTVRSKIAEADSRIDGIVESIRFGGPDMLRRGAFAWIKSKIIYPYFVRHEMSPRPFHATDDCTGCGTCALCPMKNNDGDFALIIRSGRDGARNAPCACVVITLVHTMLSPMEARPPAKDTNGLAEGIDRIIYD